MFGTMRAAIGVQRAIDNDAAEKSGIPVDRLRVTCADMIEFATLSGARACGLAARTGSLTPGKDADVLILDGGSLALTPINNPAGAIVYAAHPGTVDTVFVAGRCLKRDGKLVGVDVERIRRLATESRDELAEQAAIQLGGAWIPEATRPDDEIHGAHTH
jgi:5-methylthioadenosine/S-adenosylhomocysteine deaminase